MDFRGPCTLFSLCVCVCVCVCCYSNVSQSSVSLSSRSEKILVTGYDPATSAGVTNPPASDEMKDEEQNGDRLWKL